MKTFIILCVLLAAVGYGVTSFFFQVEETEFAIVTFFGNPRDVYDEAGLGFKWPWPVEEVIRIDRRINITSPEENEYLTRDKKNVLVSFFVAWKVKNPEQFLVTVNDRPGAESRIQDIIRSEVGAKLGNYDLDRLLPLSEASGSGRRAANSAGESAKNDAADVDSIIPEIMNEITASVAGMLETEFGIEVIAVRMKRLNFPRQNKQSVFDRMAAERARIAQGYRSEGEELAEKRKAEADRQQATMINEAQLTADEIRGKADADAARIYAEAYNKDPEFYEFLRKLEAYEAFLKQNATVVIPSDSPLLDVLKED